MTTFIEITKALLVPEKLLAVTEYEVIFITAVGVPLIVPLEVLKLKPVGSGLLIEYVMGATPVTVGVRDVIAVPTFKLSEVNE